FTLATAGPVWVDIANNADPERAATQSTFTTSLKLLRQACERFGQGLRAAGATSPSLTRSVCATDDQQAHLVTCRSAARRCVQPFALRRGGNLPWRRVVPCRCVSR